MDKAVDVHDHVVRTQLARFNGYEISTEGDAFTIAFHDAADAVAWSIATQQVDHYKLTLCSMHHPPVFKIDHQSGGTRTKSLLQPQMRTMT